MGRIGPRQQRFEVLPVPSWDVEDLVLAWRADAPDEYDRAGDPLDLHPAEPDDC